jgi:hypothetical protein
MFLRIWMFSQDLLPDNTVFIEEVLSALTLGTGEDHL